MIGRVLRLPPIALITLSLALGCGKKQSMASVAMSGDPRAEQKPVPPLPSIADFGPLETKPGSQVLTAQQSKMPVAMTVSQKKGEIMVSLSVDDSTVETEKYLLKDDALSLISASDISCVPPIPLLSKASSVGKRDEWQGKVLVAGKEFPGKATISITPSEVHAEDVDPLAAYEVDVDLSFGDPSGKPLRESFWLAPGLGIVKRAFASGTSREPSAP